MASILSLHAFTHQQAVAVRASGEVAALPTVVTAGAGSGKTRTLVGRYLALLESGLSLRSVVAITFTDKAAREMRARIRADIEIWLERCPERIEERLDDAAATAPEVGRAWWEEVFAGLDSARIGTIHSLCAEILRAHPAEAELDPDFDVLDENQTALLKARAVDAALAWAVVTPEVVPLFEYLNERQLRQALATLVEKRLDAVAAFDVLVDEGSIERALTELDEVSRRRLTEAQLARWSEALAAWLHKRLAVPAWTAPLSQLVHLQAHRSDDKLETARRDVLAHWADARAALESQDWDAMFVSILALRGAVSTGGRKQNWDPDDLAAARGAMRALRVHFDDVLAPLLKRRPISWTLDERGADALPRLRLLFDRALAEYCRLKDERRGLDFDDLEARALALLVRDDQVRTQWQAEVQAVLVDEFQDTNSRQQQIVYALSGFGEPQDAGPKANTGGLFVVGDAKQSIYRFRGADVTVFRRVQADITAAGGRHVPLDLTFRAHASLIALLNGLLAPILGEEDDLERYYAVPFAPLAAQREEHRPDIRSPYVELHLGVGENTDEGHQAAAAALARRLRRLHAEEGVGWGEVALLFRAATGFPPYEDALERAGIPFVTVAGRGFYDRPEVRDLLNGLAALADPTDDLALAGLLRSPAFALTDAALYRLRWESREQAAGGQGEGETRRQAEGKLPSPCCLWDALHGSLDHLGPSDALRAQRARVVVADLHAIVGRTSVGNLLARFLEATYYRAALYLAGGHRLCRNVDKLLADAHRSGLIGVGEFLEYVQSLRDVAAREGEAPVEAEGAVQLMTVHKAKGLESPVVVIADASRTVGGRAHPILISPELGILLRVREDRALPATYRLASLHDADRADAESRRLLYVAATRAKEKLIVSGHVKVRKDGTPALGGWLAWLGEVTGLDRMCIPDPLDAPQPIDLPWEGGRLTCVVYPVPGGEETGGQVDKETSRQGDREAGGEGELALRPGLPNMIAPLTPVAAAKADAKIRDRESDPPPRVWQVVPRTRRPEGPAWVVGKLVHAALQHWRFPDRPGLADFLRPYALEAGLTDSEEISRAVAEARRLLVRFQSHPLYAKLDQAERHHEVPYAVEVDGVPSSGIVDMLCHLDGEWTLVEFKTDRLKAGADLQAHLRQEKYDEQVRTYVMAVTVILGNRPRALLVFLNVGRGVELVPL
jgi:ATP-dependent helicase/nuclease subunit A